MVAPVHLLDGEVMVTAAPGFPIVGLLGPFRKIGMDAIFLANFSQGIDKMASVYSYQVCQGRQKKYVTPTHKLFRNWSYQKVVVCRHRKYVELLVQFYQVKTSARSPPALCSCIYL
jgi:hypothetical protein